MSERGGAVALVDANVLIDVATADPSWAGWSRSAMLEVVGRGGSLAINPIIYAEVSVAYESAAELDRVLPSRTYERLALPWEAAHLAGRRFVEYRRAGGSRRSPLPDFYIGAHAETAGLTLLTRDPSRFRTYFPAVDLVAPDVG